MSNSTQSPPEAPSGIDPEVLSKINALFEKPEAIVTLSSRKLLTETTKTMEGWWTNTGSPSADRDVVEGVADEEQNEDGESKADEENGGSEADEQNGDSAGDEEDDFEFNDEDFFLPASEDDIDSNIRLYDLDSLPPPESTPALQPIPQPVDPRAPKIIARYIYPSERQPGTPPPLPPRPGPTWPTLPYLFAMFYRFIVELIKDLICNTEPAIIEYSDRQIRQNANEVRVETQAVEFEVPASTNSETTAPETVVGVVALLHVGQNDQREAIPIIAKPKRVRQLLRDDGYDLVEDVYGVQIKKALKELGDMTGA